jgi:large subunit ribosomal protein L17
MRGLAASLIVEERIRTSEAKAKVLRQYADKLVTLGKSDTLHARRQALQVVEDSDVVHKLFAEIAPRYAERNGGYTRILKLGPRKGDAAPMAIIEFVEGETEKAAEEEPGRRRGRRRRKKDEPEDDAPAPKAGRSKARRAETGPEEAESDSEETSPVSSEEPEAESESERKAGE